MFLHAAASTPEAERMFQSDLADDGFVMNLTRLWAWRPDIAEQFGAVRRNLTASSGLQKREVALVACAAASTLGDAYCALSFGTRFAAAAGADAAAAVIEGAVPADLTVGEKALLEWTRKVVKDPNATTQADVDRLRAAGLADKEIFEATVLAAFRVAFATVNDALGARPDGQVAQRAPAVVRAAVAFGRPAESQPA